MGKTIRERARALVDIAHPNFHAELLAAAKRRHYVFPDQIIPRGKYPWREASLEKLRDGREIVVRPVRITDEEFLQRLFCVLSDESTYKRFMHYKRAHPHEEMQQLVDLDYERNMALVACLPNDGPIHLAEIAFVVRDDWQCRGIGTLLLRRMADIARDRGLAGFEATVLASNKPMLMVFHRSGLKIESTLEDGVHEVKAYLIGACHFSGTARRLTIPRVSLRGARRGWRTASTLGGRSRDSRRRVTRRAAVRRTQNRPVRPRAGQRASRGAGNGSRPHRSSAWRARRPAPC